MNAKEVVRDFGEDLRYHFNQHRTKVVIAGVILLAVIIVLLLWISGVIGSGATSGTNTQGAARVQLGNTDGIKKLNDILNDHADRLNTLTDDDAATKKDVQTLKNDISALKSGQQNLQSNKLDLDELNRRINEDLKVKPLKPLSQIAPNFLPRPA